MGLCWGRLRHEVTKSGQIMNVTATLWTLLREVSTIEIRILKEEVWRGFHFRKVFVASLWREEEIWGKTEEKQ